MARKTGLSVHTLRGWDRRYGLVEPQRSGGGTRLYSTADIARLRLLRRATESGHPISHVASFSTEKLRELLREELAEDRHRSTAGSGRADPDPRWLTTEILKGLELMDGERVHSLLMRAVVAMPVRTLIEEVVLPVLRQVGDRWAAGTICPAHEHLLSVHVQRVLAWLTDSVPVPADAAVALVTPPAGQWHEMGAQIAGVLTKIAGWRVVFLGPNLSISRAVEITGAKVVLLGVTIAENEKTVDDLLKLKEALPSEVAIVVGGRGAEPFDRPLVEHGIASVQSCSALESLLQEIADLRTLAEV